MTARKLLLALIVLVLSLGLAACGDLEDDSSDEASQRGELTEGTTTSTTTPERDLPPRPAGVVQVEGELDGSLVEVVDREFDEDSDRKGVAVSVEEVRTDEETGFEELCKGQIDVAVASRRITDAELEACSENGLQVVDFQVAFDAIVIATQNEADVGADCVNLAQLRAMFGAGSPVTAWNQLNPNFSVLQIRPTGPVDGTLDFEYFGSRVLGVPDPTLANFRNDYRAFPRELQAKNYVSGAADPGNSAKFRKLIRKDSKKRDRALRQLKKRNKELKVASKELNDAGDQLDDAVKEVAKPDAGPADKQYQAEAEARHDRAKKFWKIATKAQKKAQKKFERFDGRLNKNTGRFNRSQRLVPPGAVGIFSFSFYELWEEKLRPLEIDGQTGDRCVFPSEETISSELYPLERTLRLYTTARSLRRPEVQSYINFQLQNADRFTGALDLIPIPQTLLEEELAKIREPVPTESSAEAQAGESTTSTTTTGDESETTTEGESETTTGDETETTTEDETTTSTTTDETG